MKKNQDSLLALFEIQVEQEPARIAAIFGEKVISYAELNQKANQLAHYLLAIGIRPDDRIALCLDRSFELLIAIVAILKAGAAYLPLDPAHPNERLFFILNDNNQPILIIQSSFKDKFKGYHGKLIFIDDTHEIKNLAAHNPNQMIAPHQLAYVIYTSGTTGKPKGVLIEHQSLVSYCHWFGEYSACKPRQHIDFSSNYIFDITITTSTLPFMLGLTIVICDELTKKNVKQYLNYLHQYKINIIKMTPSYFKLLIQEVQNYPIPLPDLDTIVLGGENLTSVDCRSWLNIYPHHRLFNEYGPTETTIAVSQYLINPSHLATLGLSVPIGKPSPSNYWYLVDPDNPSNLVTKGEPGELYIGGTCLARGYLNQPELTQKMFIRDPFSQDEQARLYKTGDLCLSLADGLVEYLGRIDDQIKIRGYRIEPGEIESRMLLHPNLTEVAILVREDKTHEKRLIAYYIVKSHEKPPSAYELRQFLLQYLPDYMIPSAFVRVNQFLLTTNNKLDRKALPVPQFIVNQHYLAPTTDLEKKLADIWSDELETKPIGVKDDFFALGGHSLNAARIIASINHQLRKSVRLEDFYRAPTIEELVLLIHQSQSINPEETSLSYHHEDLFSLNHFQLLLWMAHLFEPKAKKINIVTRRRLQGCVEIAPLTFAFDELFKKHPLLVCRISTWQPALILQEKLPFKITEVHLESLTSDETTLILEKSLHELRHSHWGSSSPLMKATLFYLSEGKSELQIALPHLIADNITPDILLADLSHYYLLPNNKLTITTSERQLREYLGKEMDNAQRHLHEDIHFWETYLRKASLFAFPAAYLIADSRTEHFNFSTYLEIPEQTLANLQSFCAQNHLSIHDSLCAALTLALYPYCQPSGDPATILLTLVKTTRDNPYFDNLIGCFLSMEPLLVAIDKTATLMSLAQQIHQSALANHRYQHCPSLIKLACIKHHQKRKWLREFFIKWLGYFYIKCFPKIHINRKFIEFAAKLTHFDRNNRFLINVNIQNNLTPKDKTNKSSLFGFKTEKISSYPYDLLNINNMFDVSFFRDENSNTPYLVISANLTPSFRESIAREILRWVASLS